MKIRKSRTLSVLRLSVATIVAGGVLLGSAAAQEAEVTANAGYVSQYFYRGILQKNIVGERRFGRGFRTRVCRHMARRRRGRHRDRPLR